MTTTDIIGADVFDSRAVIERIADLQANDERDEDEQSELAALEAFAEQAGEVSDWQYGEAFVRDDYFEEYAQDLASDIGAIPDDYSWPTSHIDWVAAANALRGDYTSYELDGVTYWARA